MPKQSLSRCLFRGLPVAIAFAAALSSTAPRAAFAAGMDGLTPGSAAQAIYGSDHLADLGTEATLVYDYDMSGSIMETPFHDEVVLAFRHPTPAADAPAAKSGDAGSAPSYAVTATLFPGTRNQEVGPISATTFNPLLVLFFQRDVNQMGRNTGGSSHYFRNVIRRAMAAPGHHEEESVEISWNGQTLPGTRVTFSPFLTDANRQRMKGFAAKTYAVTLAQGVPGGVYEISTQTAEPDGGKVLLREVYTLRERKP